MCCIYWLHFTELFTRALSLLVSNVKVIYNASMTSDRSTSALNVWALAGDVGFVIAVPLVVLVLLGIKLDKYLGTMPLFIILGMLLAGVISTLSIARKVKRLEI